MGLPFCCVCSSVAWREMTLEYRSLDPFVGASHQAVVAGLLRIYDALKDGSPAHWVALEAPSGWGKTRIVHEFYESLASDRQLEPAYWPAHIAGGLTTAAQVEPMMIASRRKVAYPKMQHNPHSVPAFMWWGLRCSDQDATSLACLHEGLDQLKAHEMYLDDSWRQAHSRRARMRDLRRGLKGGGSEVAEGVVDGAFGAAVGLPIPIVGPVRTLLSNITGLSGSLADRRERTESRADLAVDEDDIAGEVAVVINRFSSPECPTVVFVEDVALARPTLVRLLRQLADSTSAVLVVTTSTEARSSGNSDLSQAFTSLGDRVSRLTSGPPAVPDRYFGSQHMAPLKAAELTRVAMSFGGLPPQVAEAASARFPNPTALKMLCSLPRVQRLLSSGSIQDLLSEVGSTPKEVEWFYEDAWRHLPQWDRVSLHVAAQAIPAKVHEAGLTSSWSVGVVNELSARLGVSPAAATSEQSAAFDWVSTDSSGLSRFLDDHLGEVAFSDDSWFGRVEMERAYRLAVPSIHSQLDRTGAIVAHNMADFLLALYRRGVTDDADVLTSASSTLLAVMAGVKEDVVRCVDVGEYATSVVGATTRDGLQLHKMYAIALGRAGRSDSGVEILSACADLLEQRPEWSSPLDLPTVLELRGYALLALGKAGQAARDLSQAADLIDSGTEPHISLRVRSTLGRALLAAKRDKAAREVLTAVITEQSLLYGGDDRRTLINRSRLAASWRGASARRGVRDLERLVAKMGEVLGYDDPERLTSQATLAARYRDVGRRQDAKRLMESVVQRRGRILGLTHPETLRSCASLASLLGADPSTQEEGLRMMEQVLQEQVNVLGSTHRSTSVTRRTLAKAYLRVGRVHDAIELLHDAVKADLSLGRASTPTGLATRAELLRLRLSMGTDVVTEAACILEESLTSFGRDHSNVAQNRSLYARALSQSGMIDEAQHQWELAVEASRLHGVERDRSMKTDYAAWLVENGRSAEADKILRALGKSHDGTVEGRTDVMLRKATALRAAGRLVDAQRQIQRAIDQRVVAFGRDDIRTLNAELQLAQTLRATGRMQEAKALIESALERAADTHSNLHPTVLHLRQAHGGVLTEVGDTAKAIALLEALVNDVQGRYGPSHPRSDSSKQALARALIEDGQVNRGKRILEGVLDSQLRAGKPADRRVLLTRMGIARATLAEGEIAAGVEQWVSLRTDVEAALGPGSADAINTVFELVAALQRAGETERALSELRRKVRQLREDPRSDTAHIERLDGLIAACGGRDE